MSRSEQETSFQHTGWFTRDPIPVGKSQFTRLEWRREDKCDKSARGQQECRFAN
ncbi:hypothetical protein SAE02_73380 [Skermanella aerolata]|uniref:Uncharacterized protein n=1 Tax=Skermanella aerolata TaxID=393310 RepID=A0A512E405_9PROT|nr:hypothetical protein SAE02_73380 [Skermanella aerolata]